MFYEANERPRHATTTVAIRSKPVAPGVGLSFYSTHILCRLDAGGNLYRTDYLRRDAVKSLPCGIFLK
jgi:hypothetical protein